MGNLKKECLYFSTTFGHTPLASRGREIIIIFCNFISWHVIKFNVIYVFKEMKMR